MTDQDKNDLRVEIAHIFDSGANEIRILDMVETFINRRYKAINFIPCCTELKADRKVMTFEEFKKELFREKDGVFQWKTETRNRWFTEEYVRGAYNL